MSQQLGFYVIQTYRQYVRPNLATGHDATLLAEVNNELGYDLIPEDGPVDAMVGHFRRQIPERAADSAARWAITAPAAFELFAELRKDSLNFSERANATDRLAEAIAEAHGEPVDWRSTAT
jgi:hypothetical protein